MADVLSVADITPIDNSDVVDLTDVVFVKQLGGAEDLQFGFGTVMQIRNGHSVVVSLINADTIPYDTSDTIKTILDKILLKYPL